MVSPVDDPLQTPQKSNSGGCRGERIINRTNHNTSDSLKSPWCPGSPTCPGRRVRSPGPTTSPKVQHVTEAEGGFIDSFLSLFSFHVSFYVIQEKLTTRQC